MHCPKCGSTDIETYHDKTSSFTVARQGDRIFHCSACGLRLYGVAADKVVEELLAKAPKPTLRAPPMTPQPVRRSPVAVLSGADMERAADLRDEAQKLRTQAKALRSKVRPNDDHDRALNLATVDTGRVVGLTEKVNEARSIDEKNKMFAQIEDILKIVRDRIRTVTGLPATRPAPRPIRERVLPLPPPVAPEPAVVAVQAPPVAPLNPVVPEPVAVCAWKGCTNPATPNSLYCSVTCKNLNAHQRDKERRKAANPSPTLPPPPPQTPPARMPAVNFADLGSIPEFTDMALAIRTLRVRHAVPTHASGNRAAER